MMEDAVTEHYRQGFRVLEVDTKRAKYQGVPWKSCSEFKKRKYENYLFISNNKKGMEYPIKIIYT